jgi:hypothetical protein
VKNFFKRIRNKHSVAKDVDEELRFHLEMQTGDFESRGLSHDKSEAMAKARFGDVEKIRDECIQISARRSVLIWVLNSVFLLNLLIGLVLRVVAPVAQITHVGDVMMMIGGLGILLVYAKQAGARMLSSDSEKFQLGLNNAPPVSFDEQGRTPFDRVREVED